MGKIRRFVYLLGVIILILCIFMEAIEAGMCWRWKCKNQMKPKKNINIHELNDGCEKNFRIQKNKILILPYIGLTILWSNDFNSLVSLRTREKNVIFNMLF